MATITIDLGDDHAARIRRSFCEYHGYRETLGDGTPNPETRPAFMKRKLSEYVRACVTAHEADAAALAARQQAILDAGLLSIG